MSKILSLRKTTRGDATTLPEMIVLAFQKAARQAPSSVIPPQQRCTILLNGVLDAAARGLRDVDRLCDEAIARLSDEEVRRYGAYRRSATGGVRPAECKAAP